ncbi:DUF2786 domain-containing protein [Erwinia amylovora]|uniref:DUF2786 domain-containing protein n=1 Tax=Erwinia amylovora TaxID=552 RepID=UPI001D083CB2|nr:DUF2786 domain-containing protein [Erwinia amylovora]UDJ86366.1 DUF2786 domain-containing protein [Erwinia amylovora]UDJ97825.1 DUF2786 domain-containing protein [Erwinia amylovora]UDK90115.1 DUF2786 domain-containing protein [Erwinia amylovora]UDK93508.1 DUF2786 domain-containing protein [Erwinia amylovora]UOD74341.1 DUF2786 domain-containing protein [Erwinia amylovora]
MSEQQKLMGRIQRLMALGTRNSNPHEAARALALAQRLMQRYGLSPDMLLLAEVSESVCSGLSINAETVPAWLNSLAAVVCMATGCRCWFGWYVYTSVSGARTLRRSLHFYGFSERPEVAAYVFSVLQRQLRAGTDKHMARYRRRRILIRTVRRRADQFREGWVSGVWQVLHSFDPSIDESRVLQRWLTQRLKGDSLTALTVREAGSCRGDKAARQAGWFAGRQADLHHGLAGAQAAHLITAGGSGHD